MNTGQIDPYFDDEINELRNLLGASSPEEFNKCEPQIVFANQLELESINIPRTNNLNELLLIHKQLFKGIYDWAGKIRIVDIKKNTKNSDFFLPVGKIAVACNYVFTELFKENYLKDLSVEVFIKRLAYYYDQLNYIHPFREGNGRTQRVFWTRLARDAGYNIDWSLVVGAENDEASRLASEEFDISGLEKMFSKIVTLLP
ncbi:MAG: cell filamentation protein [Patescibacteria group bacterium]|nr:cell filamentation protein [Patescibacteria group bacterium]